MNTLDLKSWSERQQVLAVILLAGLAIFLLWFFLLTPLNRRRQNLEREIAGMSRQLEAQNYLVGEDALKAMLAEENDYGQSLGAEWSDMLKSAAAFTNVPSPSARGDIIDYKVALFEVSQRLLRKSRTRNISLPHRLGMSESVRSDEDARRLMLQLRAVERFADMALDLKIDRIRNIEPLAPVKHETADQQAYMEEYPVRVECHGNMEDLNNILHAVRTSGSVFILRRLRVEPVSREDPEVLSIYAVASAMVFLKRPDEITVSTVKRTPVGPMGH